MSRLLTPTPLLVVLAAVLAGCASEREVAVATPRPALPEAPRSADLPDIYGTAPVVPAARVVQDVDRRDPDARPGAVEEQVDAFRWRGRGDEPLPFELQSIPRPDDRERASLTPAPAADPRSPATVVRRAGAAAGPGSASDPTAQIVQQVVLPPADPAPAPSPAGGDVPPAAGDFDVIGPTVIGPTTPPPSP